MKQYQVKNWGLLMFMIMGISINTTAQVFPGKISSEWEGKKSSYRISARFPSTQPTVGKCGSMEIISNGVKIGAYNFTGCKKTNVGFDLAYVYTAPKKPNGVGYIRVKVTGSSSQNASLQIVAHIPNKGKGNHCTAINNVVLKPKKEVRTKTITAYSVNTNAIRCGEDFILFAENTQNNPVFIINSSTGESKCVLDGIANVYENARDRVDDLYLFDNRLVLKFLTGNHNGVYTGTRFKAYSTSFDSNSVLEGWDYIRGMSGKYAFVGNSREQYELWDMDELKMLYRWKAYNSQLPYPNKMKADDPVFIASDKSIWYIKGDQVSTGVIQLVPEGGYIYNYPLVNEDYIRKNHVTQFRRVRQFNDYIYVACERRIYRMNMLSPGTWEEFARIPISENNTFYDFYIAPNGNMLVVGQRVELYRPGSFDKPQLLGTDYRLKTGLKEYAFSDLWLNFCSINADKNSNFIFFKDSELYIYNPDGLVGYTETYGKVTDLR